MTAISIIALVAFFLVWQFGQVTNVALEEPLEANEFSIRSGTSTSNSEGKADPNDSEDGSLIVVRSYETGGEAFSKPFETTSREEGEDAANEDDSSFTYSIVRKLGDVQPSSGHFSTFQDETNFDHSLFRFRRGTVPSASGIAIKSTLSTFRIGEVNTVQVNISIAGTGTTTVQVYVNRVARIFTINNPKIAYIGSNLNGNYLTTYFPNLSSALNVSNYNDQNIDWFQVSFSSVTNTGTSQLDETQNDIILQFDLIVRNSSYLTENAYYPIDINYYLPGAQYYQMLTQTVQYVPDDWQANIKPSVTVTQAPNASMEAGSTVGWLVNITGLTDAINTIRVGAYLEVGSLQSGIRFTNIERIAVGDAFSYNFVTTTDTGNVRADPGVVSMRTPYIDLVNKDYWLDIAPSESDYATYLVMAYIDPIIDTTQTYTIYIEVKSVNYNYTYTIPLSMQFLNSTTLSADPMPGFSASLVSPSIQLMPGSLVAIRMSVAATNAYSDAYEIAVDVPASNCSFAFLGTALSPTSNMFEPFDVSSVVASLNGNSVVTSAIAQVDKVVINIERTGLSAVANRQCYFYATFVLLSSSTSNFSTYFAVSTEYYAESRQWAENILPLYVSSGAVADPASSKKSSISTASALNDSFLYPWGSQSFYLNVQIPNGKTYTNITLTATSPIHPTSGLPLVVFSSVSMFDQDPELFAGVATSTVSTANGYASITFSYIYCQSGSAYNNFRVLFTFGTPYIFNLVDQTSYNVITTAIGYSPNYLNPTALDIGTATLTAAYTFTFRMQRDIASLVPAPAPYIMWSPLTPTTVLRGGTATFDVSVILPARFNAWTQLDAMILSIELPFIAVCHITPQRTSTNPFYPISYPRYNASYIYRNRGAYAWGHTTVIDPVNAVTFHLGQVAVAVRNNTNLVNMSTHWFALGFSTVPWQLTFQNVSITAKTNMNLVTSVTLVSFTKQSSVAEVTNSAGAVYTMQILTPSNSIGRYQFDFYVTRGASICSVVIVNSGMNIACMNNTANVVSTTSPDGGLTNASMTVIVDALANTVRFDSPNTAADNTIYVDVGVCVSPFSVIGSHTLPAGAALNVTGKLTVDGSLVSSNQILSQITADQIQSELPSQVSFNLMGVASGLIFPNPLYGLYNISVVVPPYTASTYTLKVVFPLDPYSQLVFANIWNMSIVAVGKNIICTPVITSIVNSSLGTSQNDTALLVFGITNAGSWTEMPDYYDFLQSWDDNQVTIGLYFSYSDPVGNILAVTPYVNATLSYNNSNNILSTSAVMPMRAVTGQESATLVANWTFVQEPATQSPFGTLIYVYGTVSHTLASTGHAYLVSLQFAVPPGVTFPSLYASETNTPAYIANTTGAVVSIQWDMLLLEETCTFNLSLLIDPTQTSGPSFTIYRHEFIASLRWRRASKLLLCDQLASTGLPMTISPQYMMSDLYGYETDRGEFTIAPPTCNAPLGMANPAIITDCMIYASSLMSTFQGRSLYKSGAMPGRLGDTNMPWLPWPRGNPFFGSEFLLINLGAPSTIAAIDVQGDTYDPNQFVAALQISYSVDGTRWQTYLDATGNSVITIPWSNTSHPLHEVASTLLIPPITEAIYVQISPVEAGTSPTLPFMPLKIELRGCAPAQRNKKCIVGNVEIPQASAPNTAPSTAFQTYFWVEDSSMLFACSQPSTDQYASCSRYDWANSDWKDIPASVVLAYDPNSQAIVGLTGNGMPIVSFDDGYTWGFSDNGALTDFLAAYGVTMYKSIPYGETLCTKTADYNYNNFGFASASLGQYFSVKQTGIVYGTSYNSNAFSNDLFYWGFGPNWTCQ